MNRAKDEKKTLVKNISIDHESKVKASRSESWESKEIRVAPAERSPSSFGGKWRGGGGCPYEKVRSARRHTHRCKSQSVVSLKGAIWERD